MFMKKAGKILSLIVAMGVAFSTIVTVSANAQEIASADDIMIDYDQNIGNPGAGDSFTVVLRYVDTGAAVSGPVSWRTSDSSVASVSGSTATATVRVLKNNSTFDIMATASGYTTDTGTWHTRQVASQITSVTVNQSSVSLSGKGSTAQITVRMTRSGNGYLPGSVPDVTSSNSGVAVGERVHSSWNQSFLGGYVTITATGSGSATVTIKSSDGPSASCRVTVSGCGGSTTVTNNPRPSATGGPGGTTAKSPVGEAGTSTNPGGTAAAGNAGSSNAPVPSGLYGRRQCVFCRSTGCRFGLS